MSRLITASSMLLLVAVVSASATRAEAGDPKRAAADCKLALDRQEFASGLEQCRTAAKFGDRASAFRIGELYEYGLGVERSIQQASNWYRRSAARGYPLAQRNLAALYERGDSGLQDNWRAFELYKKAAVQGEIYSQYKVGLMYLAGVGVEADEAAGLDWIGKSANGGLPQAANFAASYVERLNAKTLWVRHKLAPYWRKPDIEATEEPPSPRKDALAALGERVWTVSHQAPLIRQPIAPAPAPKPLVVARADVKPTTGAPSSSLKTAPDKPESDAEHTRRLVVDLPNQPDVGNLITLVPKAVEVGAAPQPVIPPPPAIASKTAAKAAIAAAAAGASGDKGRAGTPAVTKTAPAVAKAEPAATKVAPVVAKAEPAAAKTAPVVAKNAPSTPKPETARVATAAKPAKNSGAEPAAPAVAPAIAAVTPKQPDAQSAPEPKGQPVVIAATSKAPKPAADSRKAAAITPSSTNTPVAAAELAGTGAKPKPQPKPQSDPAKAPILVASTAPLAVVVGPKPVVPKTAAINAPVTNASTSKAQATKIPATKASAVNVATAKAPAAAVTEQARGLAAHASERYTVQLALMGQKKSVARFYRMYGMRGEVKHYPTQIDGKPFYVFVYGDFASYAEAKAAAAALPAPVQELRPWIRRFEALQKDYPSPDAGQA